jgi:hypothetical protein
LPFVEQDNLYNQFHLNEPWDSPHNIALVQSMPKVYHCPARPVEINTDRGSTYYQAFIGARTGFGTDRGLRLPQDFPDGPSYTILVVEGRSAVPWTKPEDIAYDPDGPLPALGGIFTGESRFNLFGRKNARGFYVALADGSTRFVTDPFDETALREFIDRGDGTQKRSLNLFK